MDILSRCRWNKRSYSMWLHDTVKPKTMRRGFITPKKVLLGSLGICAVLCFTKLVDIVFMYDPEWSLEPFIIGPINRTDFDIRDTEFQSLNLFQISKFKNFALHIKMNVTDDGKQCSGRRFLAYTCNTHCGGWGDRLKGMTTLFLLAMLTNRTFVIDMPQPCDLHEILMANRYDWNHCLSDAKRVRSEDTVYLNLVDKVELNVLESLITGDLSKTKAIFIQTNTQLVRQIRQHGLSNKLIPWININTDEEVIGSITGTLFRPRSQLTEALVKFKTEKVRNRRLVCSHIRYGLNPSIPHDTHLPKGRPNVRKVVRFLKRYDGIEDIAVFVASDSADIRDQIRKLFTNFVSTDRSILHVDTPEEARANGACEGFFTVILEQLILSKCDVLLLTRSNLGAMAAYMRGISKNIFLDVKGQEQMVNVNVSDIQNIYGFV